MNQRAFEPPRKAVPSGLSGHCTPPQPWLDCGWAQPPSICLSGRHVGGRKKEMLCRTGLSNPLSSFRIKTGIKRNVKQRNLNISNLFSDYRQPIISFSWGFCPLLFLFLWIPHQPVGLCWVKLSSPLVAGLCLLNGDECQCHPAH